MLDQLQSCPDCCELAPPIALSSIRFEKYEEDLHGNNFDRASGASSARRPSNVALQQQLGVLPQRRSQTGLADCGSSGTQRQRLTGVGISHSPWRSVPLGAWSE